jgi:hypothetical protein
MTKPYTLLSAVAALSLAVCAQSPSSSGQNSSGQKLSGTIDGRPIPESTFRLDRYGSVGAFIHANHRLPTGSEEQALDTEANSQRQICGNLRSIFGGEAHESERLRLGIVPTAADLDEAARHTSGVSEAEVTANYPKRHALSAALVAGFAAVLENGQDPHAVYLQTIQEPAGIPEDMWLNFLYTARTNPRGRKRLEHDSTLTLQDMIRETKSKMALGAASKAPGGLSSVAAYYVVNRQVDQLIAANDPTFRTYLAEFPDQFQGHGNGDHLQYLQRKRNEYWKAVVTKLNVWLSDPSLFATCKLADLGVTVRK